MTQIRSKTVKPASTDRIATITSVGARSGMVDVTKHLPGPGAIDLRGLQRVFRDGGKPRSSSTMTSPQVAKRKVAIIAEVNRCFVIKPADAYWFAGKDRERPVE